MWKDQSKREEKPKEGWGVKLQESSQVCKVLYFYLANNVSHVVIFRKDIPHFDKSYDWACVLGIEIYNEFIQ